MPGEAQIWYQNDAIPRMPATPIGCGTLCLKVIHYLVLMGNINQMNGHNGQSPMKLGPSRIGIVRFSTRTRSARRTSRSSFINLISSFQLMDNCDRSQLSHNQNLVHKWPTQNHVKN